MDNFPRTALNCRNLSCNNTMRTGEIYIDGFCGGCYGNRNKKKEYEYTVGGRKNGKRIARLLEFDENIRQGKFPILVLVKPNPAVVISLDEYKRLKELEEDKLDSIFDIMREKISNSIGMSKETLFINIYGNDEEKRKYKEFLDRTWNDEERPKD